MKRNVVAAGLLLCFCVGWASLNPSVGLAASFVVSSTADAPDATPGNGVCASAGGACTLRAAVMEANASGGGTISVPAGTYTLTISGQAEDAAAKGDLDITAGTVTITGAGRDVTIIDGNKLDRIFDAKSGTNVTITGLTLQNGKGDAADSSTFSQADGGGALRAYEADVTLGQVTIKNNTSASNGGGVAFSYTQFGRPTPKTLTINDSVISGNTANFSGGGVIIGSGAKLNLAGSTISGNKASALNSDARRGGGGLFVGQGYTPVGGTFIDTQATIANTTFANNTASDRNASNLISGGAWGGAIQSQKSTVTITSSAFNANIADGTDGGAILTDDTVLNVAGSTFDSNISLGNGGAISTLSGKSITIASSAFTNNKALDGTTDGGGALHALADITDGSYKITNSSFTGNHSDANGGAIVAGPNVSMDGLTINNNDSGSNGGGIDVIRSLPNAPTTLTNSALTNNTAYVRGGGIENGDVLTMANVLISGNKTTTSSGGGMSIYQSFSTTATNVVITSNTSADQGGGLYVRHRGIAGSSSNQPTTPVFTNVVISGNQAATAGGGIANLTSIKLVNATINGNIAKTNGGGIWLFNGFSASDDLARYAVNVDLTNATITGNTATNGSGGALYQQTYDVNNPQYAVSRINNATIVSNNAGAATGGVFLDTSVSSAANSITVQNSILAKNGGVSSPDCLIITSVGSNLVGNSDGCVIKSAAASDQIGTMASPIDPLVGALADNGTAPGSVPLQTMALQAGSPAIDKGNPATCPASDERGAPRVGTCDVGAFEFGATVPTPTPVTPTPVTPTPETPTPVTPTPVTPTPVTPGTTLLYLPLTTR